MKTKLIGFLVGAALAFAPWAAFAQSNTVVWSQIGTSASGAAQYAPASTTNPVPVTVQSGGGTEDVNLKQVNGTTVTEGAGTGAAGTQRVTTSTDSTIGTVTSVTAVTTLGTVTNPVGVKGADGSGIVSNANPLPISDAGGSITVDCTAATCAINNAQVNGVTLSTGAGAVGTGSQRVAVGQDTTTIAGSAPGTAASPSANVLSSVNVASAASTAGVAPVQSSAVETGHVIKASAGNLYDFNVSADATLAAAQWEVLIFNSTTVPASGAVTPVKCYIAPAGTTSVSGAFPTPMYLGTGISIAVSTAATCFTKTDSAHGFISANAQ